MKKLMLFFLLSTYLLAGLNLQDKTLLTQPSYTLSGEFSSDISELLVNGEQVRINKDGKFKTQLFFNKIGKNLVVVESVGQNNQREKKEYRVLFLRSFNDLPENSIYTELATAGLYAGYADGCFKPNELITRGQSAAIAVGLLDLPAEKNKTALKQLIEIGIFSDIDDGENGAGQQLARAEVVTMFCRLESLAMSKDKKESSRFKDINQNSWYFGYVQAAEKAGWLDIYKQDLFMPAQKVTRKEFVDLLAQLPLTQKKLYEIRDWENGYTKEQASLPRVANHNLISLSFDNMKLTTILNLIAKESGLSIIIGQNVSGYASGHFKDVYPEVALDNVLKANGYTYVVDDNLYRIVKVNKPVTTPKTNNNVVEFKINYASIDKVVEEICKMAPELKDRIIVSRETSTLLINKKSKQLALATDIIKMLDNPPLQVMVEARIFEISAESSRELGTKILGTDPSDSKSTIFETTGLATVGRGGLYVRSLDKDFQVYLNALETKKDFNMISSPRVIVVNNKEAVLETLDEVAYEDETVVNSISGTVTSKKLIFKNVGTTLKFIPHINEKGYITLELFPEISSAVKDSTTNYPLINKTKAYTRVVIKDGETFLLGGLLRDSEEVVRKKVPLLGDIPLLRFFFSREEKSVIKKDVIIMITPRILDPFNVGDFQSEANQYLNR